VIINEKRNHIRDVEIVVLYRGTYILIVLNKLRLQAISQFNIYQIPPKTAICNKQVAVFLL